MNSVFIVIQLLFINIYFISTKKVITPRNADKVNKCDQCKILSDSFNYWLDKTSRGKFEGGDAAWEETKLKSYSKSEVRLVEIQEKLCSDVKKHKDYCYALNEEVEHFLETWWFEEDIDNSVLFTWLCVDKLQYCCPTSHYGKNCNPCPTDLKSKVCSGNGQCDGDGSRRGNGSCICNKGYTGKLCLDCAETYFKNTNMICESCHISCASCTGKDRGDCVKCSPGWSLSKGNECVDIDECRDSSICKSNQYCENSEGSYVCKLCDVSCKTCKGPQASECTSCQASHLSWNGLCVDEIMKENLMKKATQTLLLYLGLMSISFFIFKHSKLLATFVIVILSVYVYVVESKTRISSFDVFLNLFFSS